MMSLQRFMERLIWLCMLPLVVSGAVLVGSQLVALDERRDLVAQSVVRTAARSIDHVLQVRLASLELMGHLLEDMAEQEGGIDRNKALSLAQRFVDVHGNHVVLGTEYEHALVNTRLPSQLPLPTIPHPPGESAFQQALATGLPQVSDVFVGPLANRELVALAVPLNRIDKPRYVLASTVEVEELQRNLTEYALPPGWSLAVLDRSRKPVGIVGPLTTWPTREAGEGSDRVLCTAQLSVAPWTVELHAPKGWLSGTSLRETLLLLMMLLGAIGTAYVGGRIASRRLTTAIRSLKDDGRDPPAGRDILEVAQVRHELHRLALERELSEARVRAVFESAQDAILCFDDDLRVVQANEAAAKMHGCELSSLIGRSVLDWIPQRHRLQFDRMLHHLREEGLDTSTTAQHQALDAARRKGNTFPVEISMSRVIVQDVPMNAAVFHDITRRQAVQRRLRRMLRDRQDVEETERRRIGLEVHDELQQRLALIRNDLVRLTQSVPSLAPAMLPVAAPAPHSLIGMVEETIETTRRLVQDLRPQVLDDLGLAAGLEDMLDRLRHNNGVPTDLQVLGEDRVSDLDPRVATTLYRIAQEALNNVFKHSKATHVHLTLDLSNGTEAVMEVIDDGVGFDEPKLKSTSRIGLLGMLERAQSLGGTLVVQSHQGEGTAVVVRVPMTIDDDAEMSPETTAP